MIRADQIPDEAMNALLRALQLRKGGREAFAAALNAWPGVYPVNYGGDEPPFLVLPLPKENANAEV